MFFTCCKVVVGGSLENALAVRRNRDRDGAVESCGVVEGERMARVLSHPRKGSKEEAKGRQRQIVHNVTSPLRTVSISAMESWPSQAPRILHYERTAEFSLEPLPANQEGM